KRSELHPADMVDRREVHYSRRFAGGEIVLLYRRSKNRSRLVEKDAFRSTGRAGRVDEHESIFFAVQTFIRAAIPDTPCGTGRSRVKRRKQRVMRRFFTTEENG